MTRVNLNDFPEVWTKLRYYMNSFARFTLDEEIDMTKRFFKDEYKVEIEAKKYEPHHIIYMDEKLYFWFKLRWS